MEGLEKNIKNLSSMLNELDKMLKHLENARIHPEKYNELDLEGFRESSIKRFELSFGLFWKLLKSYLEQEFGAGPASPKKIIRQCFVERLLTGDEEDLLLEMVDNRNASTHDYDLESAIEFSKRIPFYHKLMSDVLNKIKSDLGK